jgi:CopG family transcriptional regulator, nickel-responsive regulator
MYGRYDNGKLFRQAGHFDGSRMRHNGRTVQKDRLVKLPGREWSGHVFAFLVMLRLYNSCYPEASMKKLIRFGVSLDHHLLDDFDLHIKKRKYTNRSEALRDLIRDNLVGQEWDDDKETVGTITFVYDHHVRDLTRKLTHIQHDFQGHIMAGMHVHLDHDHCLEVLVAKGKGSQIRKVADALVSVKGVKHGKLTMTTTGKGLV